MSEYLSNSYTTCTWARKCYKTLLEAKMNYNQLVEVHLLIPARTDTTYFQEYIYLYAKLDFIKGRLKFRDLMGTCKEPTSAPFPSIVRYDMHLSTFASV